MSRFRSRRTHLNIEYFREHQYKRCYWKDWDYSLLHDRIMTRKRRGRSDSIPWNDVIIMADTETSKSPDTKEIIEDPDYIIMSQELSIPISVSYDELTDIPDYKDFLKSFPGIIDTSGIPLDYQWQEWSAQYPWIFKPDITANSDRLILIRDYYNKVKPDEYEALENHVCFWTISLRAYHHNIVTLYGYKPSEMAECMSRIHDTLPGQRTVIYWHNMSYDWTFMRAFFIKAWGEPEKLLATKPHYPIWIKFENDINFKDSLILFQRSLEKAGVDFHVEHAKAVGIWDYEKIRHQCEPLSEEEITYPEYDTLCGVECLDIFMQQLGKDITSIPYTSTGIVRNDTRTIGKNHNAHEQFTRICIEDPILLMKAQRIFSGGFTHANRYIVGYLLTEKEYKEKIVPYDFASSYPFIICSFKMPMEKYMELSGTYTAKDILNWYKSDYSVLFTIRLTNVHLKDLKFPMPYIQQAGERVHYILNGIFDNGRVLDADEIIMEICEVDFYLIDRYYSYDICEISDVYIAKKDYLPRWFTDYVFNLYKQKCELKGGDPVAYDISKTRVNACFGMCAQRPVPDDIKEDYQTGEYYQEPKNADEFAKEYEKFVKRQTSILPYQWGIYVTAYARFNLFMLGECAGQWLYSDTDSVYGMAWNVKKVDKYNEYALNMLRNNGYDIITVKGKEYQLGKAELDYKPGYSEFKTMGAKRYAVRKADTGEVKITVAGVPKKTGALCLKNDLRRFKKGFIFDGAITGKKTHTFIMNSIHIDKWGNEVADSIDLSPCDYKLDMTPSWDWIWDEVIGSFEIECLDEGVIT